MIGTMFLLTGACYLLGTRPLFCPARETKMTFKTFMTTSLLTLGLAAFAAPVLAAADMKALDPDNDGTVSLAEAQAAATAKFDALDPDKDGTIDKKEAKGTVSKAGFKAADPDKDGTISKDEYLAAVTATFKKADKDGDGTLDAKELASPTGRSLMKWLQ